MSAATKFGGFKYWEYVLIHTGNLLVIYHLSDLVMKGFHKAYILKVYPKTGKKWYKPSTYLGADLAKFQVSDTGETRWSMSGDIYIRKSINMVKEKLDKSNRQLYNNTNSDIQTSYQTEIDVSLVLFYDQSNYYLSALRLFIWFMELGCIDINIEIAL